MRDIADAVGLSKPALYYYVTSKEELLVQLYEHVPRRDLARAPHRGRHRRSDDGVAVRARGPNSLHLRDRRLLQIFFEEEAELPARLTRKGPQPATSLRGALIELLARAASEASPPTRRPV